MKKKLMWKIVLFVGLCPFIAPFFYYFLQILVHERYSWSLAEMLIVWSFLYWPTYLSGLVLTVVSIFKLKI